jgi:acyl dehydratase
MRSIITDEMKSRIGERSSPWIVEFEPGAIRRYAEAIDDSNPAYHDAEYARRSPHGSVIAPPVFLGWPLGEVPSVRVESPLTRHVTGGVELTYERPIRAGERLVAYATLTEIYEKEGREGVGHLLFQVIETTYLDMDGKKVVTKRLTDITFEGETDGSA